MCVIYYEKKRSAKPQRHEISIEASYFFNSDPSTSWCWLWVIISILLCVPIPLVHLFVVNLPVFIHLWLWIFLFLMDVKIRTKFVVNISETLLSEKGRACIVHCFMVLIFFKKFLVVFVLFKFLPNSCISTCLIFFRMWAFLRLFPVLVILLVFKTWRSGCCTFSEN